MKVFNKHFFAIFLIFKLIDLTDANLNKDHSMSIKRKNQLIYKDLDNHINKLKVKDELIEESLKNAERQCVNTGDISGGKKYILNQLNKKNIDIKDTENTKFHEIKNINLENIENDNDKINVQSSFSDDIFTLDKVHSKIKNNLKNLETQSKKQTKNIIDVSVKEKEKFLKNSNEINENSDETLNKFKTKNSKDKNSENNLDSQNIFKNVENKKEKDNIISENKKESTHTKNDFLTSQNSIINNINANKDTPKLTKLIKFDLNKGNEDNYVSKTNNVKYDVSQENLKHVIKVNNNNKDKIAKYSENLITNNEGKNESISCLNNTLNAIKFVIDAVANGTIQLPQEYLNPIKVEEVKAEKKTEIKSTILNEELNNLCVETKSL